MDRRKREEQIAAIKAKWGLVGWGKVMEKRTLARDARWLASHHLSELSSHRVK